MRIVPVILLSTAILALVCAPVYAQWVRVPAGGIRRGPGPVWGMGSCEWRQVCVERCGGSQAGRRVLSAVGQGTPRSTPGRIPFGGGSDCQLPAARRAPDQCFAATLEDHPKTGFHCHSV